MLGFWGGVNFGAGAGAKVRLVEPLCGTPGTPNALLMTGGRKTPAMPLREAQIQSASPARLRIRRAYPGIGGPENDSQ